MSTATIKIVPDVSQSETVESAANLTRNVIEASAALDSQSQQGEAWLDGFEATFAGFLASP